MDEISQEFEVLAQQEYARLYRKYSSSSGKIIKEFKALKPESFKIKDTLSNKRDVRSNPIDIEYAEVAQPVRESQKGDMIEAETEL